MTDSAEVVAPAVAATAPVMSPTKARVRGVVRVVLALIVLFISLLLPSLFVPEVGQHYSWTARVVVALAVLGGMYLLFTGSWRVLVVPGAAVGAFAGALKALAVLVLILEVSLGLAYGAFMTWGLTNVRPESTGSSSSDDSFDTPDFDDWD